MIFAQSNMFMGVELTTLISVLSALGVVFAIWKKMNAAQDEIIARLKKEMRLDQATQADGQKRELGPQPFRIAVDEDFVKRTSYETHCRLNREAHKEIEISLKAELAKVADLHHSLSREVSEINSRSETNEQRLIQIDNKLDNLRTQLTNK